MRFKMTLIDKQIMALRAEVETAVRDRAANDAAFRAELKRDPHTAIKQLFNIDARLDIKINIIEEQPGEVTLVLPHSPTESELPDEILDLVSAGTMSQCQCPKRPDGMTITRN